MNVYKKYLNATNTSLYMITQKWKKWKTASVRLNEEEENALKMLCSKRNVKKHAILKSVLLRELDSFLKPGLIQEGAGIPTLGTHIFKYAPESDSFIWQLDLGNQGVHVLAENISHSFVMSLYDSLGKAIEQRDRIVKKGHGKKVVMPSSIMKYEVKTC